MPLSPEVRKRMSEIAKNRTYSPETRAKMSASAKNRKIDNPRQKMGLVMFQKGHINPPEWIAATVAAKLGKPSPVKGKHWAPEKRAAFRGSRTPNWRGGITPLNQMIRHSAEYVAWRIAVFMRDDFKCVACGQKGGRLEADHIFPFSIFKAIRYEVVNGRTLCKKCHIEYGWHPSRDFKPQPQWL